MVLKGGEDDISQPIPVAHVEEDLRLGKTKRRIRPKTWVWVNGGSRNSERGGGGGGEFANIFFFFSVNITIYKNKV